MRTIKVIICINYTIITCINDNNAVINNNYGRLQRLVLLFKILIGTQQDFFEIHRQFGHVPSKSSSAMAWIFEVVYTNTLSNKVSHLPP